MAKKLTFKIPRKAKKKDVPTPKKEETVVSYEEMVISLKVFLSDNSSVKDLRLKISEQRLGNFLVYQGSHKAWAYIRPVRCHFVRASLLRAIHKHGDDVLKTYFKDYTLIGGGR